MTTSRRHALMVSAALLALTAACGGSSPRAGAQGQQPSGSPSSGGTARASTGTPAPGSSGGPATATPGATSSTRPPSGGAYPTKSVQPQQSAYVPTPAESLKPMPFSAKLDKTCVPVGGSQTLTVTTRGGAFVVFDSKYADGTNGQTHGGNDMAGHADGTGRYTKTWTLAPTAPAGSVDLYVSGSAPGYRTEATLLKFKIATTC